MISGFAFSGLGIVKTKYECLVRNMILSREINMV